MRALATRREAADHDRGAIGRGVPGVVLMENAARGAADVIIARWSPAEWSRPLVLGGTGLNGGDGWAVARQLLTRGAQPRAILVGDPSRVLGDARINLEALRALGVPVEVLGKDDSLLEAWLSSSSLLVDAVFGTGLDRDVGGAAQQVIERANVSGKPIVALDLPSGICADTGRVLGVAIRATRTVTFGAAKRGLHQHPGVAHAGEVIVVDIGVPSGITSASLLGREDLALGQRAEDTHKGSAGRVLVLAGSPGRTGAALLAGLGALRCGAGLVTLGARGAARAALDAKVVELMTTEIPEALEAGVSAALREAASRDAAVLGPGVGLDPTARAFLERTAMELTVPTVLDADALTAFAGSHRQAEGRQRAPYPHPASGRGCHPPRRGHRRDPGGSLRGRDGARGWRERGGGAQGSAHGDRGAWGTPLRVRGGDAGARHRGHRRRSLRRPRRVPRPPLSRRGGVSGRASPCAGGDARGPCGSGPLGPRGRRRASFRHVSR
jgi:hydroxyethylthiazole kinase-like uncharacterized protein yjeF